MQKRKYVTIFFELSGFLSGVPTRILREKREEVEKGILRDQNIERAAFGLAWCGTHLLLPDRTNVEMANLAMTYY